nr:LysR family transcriptional regulator [Pseudomonas sp. 31 R 17]
MKQYVYAGRIQAQHCETGNRVRAAAIVKVMAKESKADRTALSSAADLLGQTRAVFSSNLKRLEAELGITLLTRNIRQLPLADAGEHGGFRSRATDTRVAGPSLRASSMYAMYPDTRHLPLKVRAFIDFMKG